MNVRLFLSTFLLNKITTLPLFILLTCLASKMAPKSVTDLDTIYILELCHIKNISYCYSKFYLKYYNTV